MADNEAASRIMAACNAAVADPKLRPEVDDHGMVTKTFCNLAVQRIAHAAGYDGFADMTANDIVAFCAKSPVWAPMNASQAAQAAKQGMLTIAVHEYLPHGHVACVFPDGGLVYSGKWQADCPIVCNIGHENKICGANFAFPVAQTPPTYYCWIPRNDNEASD